MTAKSAQAQHWGPARRPAEGSAPNTLSQAAYERLRADVLAGRLAPGSKLITEAIKHQYGIGGSPLREALTRLAADGLLSTEGQKGFRVATASPAELADVGRVRLELELRALGDSIVQGDVEWEVSLVSEFHRLQRTLDSFSRDPVVYANDWEASHRAYHFALLSGCGSPWLLHFCDRIYDQTERYRRLFTSHERIPKPLMSSHKEILDAALGRDKDRCLAMLARHIVAATRQTLSDMAACGVPRDANAEAAVENLANQWTQAHTGKNLEIF